MDISTIGKQLTQRLAGATRISFVAAGSEMNADDGAGAAVLRYFASFSFDKPCDADNAADQVIYGPGIYDPAIDDPAINDVVTYESERYAIQLVFGGTAPENFSGVIKDFAPTHLIIVDAADLGNTPGTVRVLNEARITGTVSGTHIIAMSVLTRYLKKETGCEIILLGIQPADLTFCGSMTPEVDRAAKELASCIEAAIG